MSPMPTLNVDYNLKLIHGVALVKCFLYGRIQKSYENLIGEINIDKKSRTTPKLKSKEHKVKLVSFSSNMVCEKVKENLKVKDEAVPIHGTSILRFSLLTGW